MFEAVCSTTLRHLTASLRSSASSRWQCLRVASLRQQWILPIRHATTLQTNSAPTPEIPFRKQLKDDIRGKREAKRSHNVGASNGSHVKKKGSRRDGWELTVGLEIHAQLNTERKLFSSAKSTGHDEPNSNVALFDLAFPGSQPEFQSATLIPALRAAASLSCSVQRKSKFDRKHYHYQDQPAGYQITQYYEPFARDGRVTLHDHDGIAAEDGTSVDVEIKQMQMEQDTAKSTLQPPSTALLDYNRVGHPLIEIITHPQIHQPQTAAACVKKIQAVLQAVNAVTTGMELGGLRADVNVSVSRAGSEGLGQRTEIKNLSSIKAVEDAIVAERDRQITVLEAGGSIYGETRGWTLGSTETTRLRGKEGEVDYRYMPDPDIPPVLIADGLINYIYETLPKLPDELITGLVAAGLTVKDAKTLVSLENGERLDYFDQVRMAISAERAPTQSVERIIANWTLHELGGLLSTANIPFSPTLVPASKMADILINLHENKITGATAKRLLGMVFDGDKRSIETIIDSEGLALQPMPQEQYVKMAQAFLKENKDKVKQIQEKKQLGKVKWFVGQMVRQGEGKIEAQRAEATLRNLLGLDE